MKTKKVSDASAALAIVIFIAVALGSTHQANASTLSVDDFSSYILDDNMSPLSSGDYAANWLSDGPYSPGVNGAWHIASDPVYAPSFGKYANTFATYFGWLAFTVDDVGPITEATLQFDYLLQTDTSLFIWVSPVDPNTDLVSVPFTFTKRNNQGQILDNTGVIDLAPYLSPSSSRLVVKFVSDTFLDTGTSHIRIDNFSLSTTAVPEPNALAMLAIGGTCLFGFIRQRRKGLPGTPENVRY